MPTEYLVLKRTRAVSTSTETVTTTAAEQWEIVSTETASSAEAAIRKAAEKVAAQVSHSNQHVDPVLVAVPARSWTPTKVKTETTVRMKLEDA